jgi:hypothetical protein
MPDFIKKFARRQKIISDIAAQHIAIKYNVIHQKPSPALGFLLRLNAVAIIL